MGMKCFKCGEIIPAGLLLPEPLTVDEFGAGLSKIGILAACNDCIEKNPYSLTKKEVDKVK